MADHKKIEFTKKNKKNSRRGITNTLDLTPVVDVVFNLLIFFALSLNFVATSGGIKVKLPSATSAKPIKAEKLTINITKDGKTYLNNDEVKEQTLRERLKRIKDKNSLVIIRADNTVKHGTVIHIMDIVKSEGFQKLAIAVEKEQKE